MSSFTDIYISFYILYYRNPNPNSPSRLPNIQQNTHTMTTVLKSRTLPIIPWRRICNGIIRFFELDFAFAKLIKCGLCGSGVCAEEKFKKLKDGSVNRHIYYACGRSRDPDCKREYINEPDLIDQFIQLMDKVSLDEVSIQKKIKKEVQRMKKFNQMLLNTKEITEAKDIDVRNYMKYILKSGNHVEKRELLRCLKGQITLSNKQISLL